jgi:hypothetical protein
MPAVYSGVARGLTDADVAPEVARQILSSLRGERNAAPLAEAARLGRAVGLSVSEMERMSGYTRQTVYSALREVDQGIANDLVADRVLLSRHLLIVLCAIQGAIPAMELAGRLRLAPEYITSTLRALQEQRLCFIEGQLSADGGYESVSVAATSYAYQVLIEMFDDLYLRHSDGFSVYLQVDPAEQHEIEVACDRTLSAHENTIMSPTIAPSVMSGWELALTVHAPTSRLAVRIAEDVWQELRKRADLAEAPARIADVIAPSPPPCGASEVLDAFTTSIAETWSAAAHDVMHERMRYPGGVDERTLAGRCLTSAARVLRMSVGQKHNPRAITDGEAAWGELMPVSGLPLDAQRTPIQRAVKQALELAADRLGPFRGGDIGSFRQDGSAPHVVQQVRPSQQDLVRMAELAGEAVGRAGPVVKGLDVAAEVQSVVLPTSRSIQQDQRPAAQTNPPSVAPRRGHTQVAPPPRCRHGKLFSSCLVCSKDWTQTGPASARRLS